MKDKLASIGKTAIIKTEHGLTVQVKILDYKNSYGRDRWLVSPLAGSGQAWVEKLLILD
jgi:hypothetical protein